MIVFSTTVSVAAEQPTSNESSDGSEKPEPNAVFDSWMQHFRQSMISHLQPTAADIGSKVLAFQHPADPAALREAAIIPEHVTEPGQHTLFVGSPPQSNWQGTGPLGDYQTSYVSLRTGTASIPGLTDIIGLLPLSRSTSIILDDNTIDSALETLRNWLKMDRNALLDQDVDEDSVRELLDGIDTIDELLSARSSAASASEGLPARHRRVLDINIAIPSSGNTLTRRYDAYLAEQGAKGRVDIRTAPIQTILNIRYEPEYDIFTSSWLLGQIDTMANALIELEPMASVTRRRIIQHYTQNDSTFWFRHEDSSNWFELAWQILTDQVLFTSGTRAIPQADHPKTKAMLKSLWGGPHVGPKVAALIMSGRYWSHLWNSDAQSSTQAVRDMLSLWQRGFHGNSSTSIIDLSAQHFVADLATRQNANSFDDIEAMTPEEALAIESSPARPTTDSTSDGFPSTRYPWLISQQKVFDSWWEDLATQLSRHAGRAFQTNRTRSGRTVDIDKDTNIVTLDGPWSGSGRAMALATTQDMNNPLAPYGIIGRSFIGLIDHRVPSTDSLNIDRSATSSYVVDQRKLCSYILGTQLNRSYPSTFFDLQPTRWIGAAQEYHPSTLLEENFGPFVWINIALPSMDQDAYETLPSPAFLPQNRQAIISLLAQPAPHHSLTQPMRLITSWVTGDLDKAADGFRFHDSQYIDKAVKKNVLKYGSEIYREDGDRTTSILVGMALWQQLVHTVLNAPATPYRAAQGAEHILVDLWQSRQPMAQFAAFFMLGPKGWPLVFNTRSSPKQAVEELFSLYHNISDDVYCKPFPIF